MNELFGRVKRYEEEARIDNDETRQALTRTSQALEERLLRDKVCFLFVHTLINKFYTQEHSRIFSDRP